MVVYQVPIHGLITSLLKGGLFERGQIYLVKKQSPFGEHCTPRLVLTWKLGNIVAILILNVTNLS